MHISLRETAPLKLTISINFSIVIQPDLFYLRFICKLSKMNY